MQTSYQPTFSAPLASPPSHSLCPILSGPTACGKTGFSIEFAQQHSIEIINADSLLVYRDFDIGTAKPTAAEQSGVPHHLIDICDPLENFSAADFVNQARSMIAQIESRGKRALIVGGTPFYLKALCFGVWEAPATHPEFRSTLEPFTSEELHARLTSRDPKRADDIHPSDRYRVIRALEILEFSSFQTHEEMLAQSSPLQPNPLFPLLWIDRDHAELESRIQIRTQEMLKHGFVDEVIRLQNQFPGARALNSVGYRQVCDYLAERAPSGRKIRPGTAGLADEIQLATRQLVKSQRTFLKGLTRNLGDRLARRFVLNQERSELERALVELYSPSS